MTKPLVHAGALNALRSRAERLLKEGSAKTQADRVMSPAALQTLHEMATAPAQASAALKLLHELQVHQVEIDLQREHCETHCPLQQDASRFDRLFDEAPFAYLCLHDDGRLIEVNRLARTWLRLPDGTASGMLLAPLLTEGAQLSMAQALLQLHDGNPRVSVDIQLHHDARVHQATVSRMHSDAAVLLAVMPTSASTDADATNGRAAVS